MLEVKRQKGKTQRTQGTERQGTVLCLIISSDEIGNIISIGNVTLDWNGRRLESISQAGTEIVSYDYNIDGQRIKKTALDLETGEPEEHRGRFCVLMKDRGKTGDGSVSYNKQ